MRFRILVLVALLVGVGSARAEKTILKTTDGKVIGAIIDCNSCPPGKKGDDCRGGLEVGYDGSEACGSCLLTANHGARLAFPADLQIMGYLKDENGDPISGKFVRIFLANGWSTRTRTSAQGVFVIRLGATTERESDKPLVVDLGVRKMRKDSKATQYVLFLVPEPHKPCVVPAPE